MVNGESDWCGVALRKIGLRTCRKNTFIDKTQFNQYTPFPLHFNAVA